MLLLLIASLASPEWMSCGWSQLETLNWARPPTTSRWASQDIGATLVYHGHVVWLERQSPHACMNSTRVCGRSQAGSLVVGGLVWLLRHFVPVDL